MLDSSTPLPDNLVHLSSAILPLRSDGERLGRITEIVGSQITVTTDAEHALQNAMRVGSLIKVSGETDVIGIVDSLRLPADSQRHVATVDLVGEIFHSPTGGVFRRGVSHPPMLGAAAVPATSEDIGTVYSRPSTPSIRIGTLSSDKTRPAYVMIDELLSKHFAVVGSTGSGKSCTVSLILSSILDEEPNAHIILLDPHNEYTKCFNGLAEVVNVENEHLPFWVLDREEAMRVMIRGGAENEQEAQAMILKDAITAARRMRAGVDSSDNSISVDTPVPFHISDFRRFLTDGMGKVDKSNEAAAYRRLLGRLDSLMEDPRFSFMFGGAMSGDILAHLIARIMRVPVAGKPVTIIDLSGVPGDIADVVVSVMCRILFDFTVWADPKLRPPVLLVCEEAHRYLPSDPGLGFAACTAAISRIAREGRKYGLSLALVSQRLTELALSAISQCGTIFSLRLSNELDQNFVQGALPDTGRTMIRALSSLPPQQAVVFGEGVSLPMQVKLKNLSLEQLPRSNSARFAEAWKEDNADMTFCHEAVRRWRALDRSSYD
ncbi:MAG TPA: ATP-binding protein [Candidatus Cybelea sp.]|nr:ATP-binding protein [Candidatus Cybelea sp.]